MSTKLNLPAAGEGERQEEELQLRAWEIGHFYGLNVNFHLCLHKIRGIFDPEILADKTMVMVFER